jgi:hypothetical protein
MKIPQIDIQNLPEYNYQHKLTLIPTNNIKSNGLLSLKIDRGRDFGSRKK